MISEKFLTQDVKYAILQEACRQGCIDTVRLILEHNVHINETKMDTCTPLCLACEYGHGDIVDILLAHGANPRRYSNEFVEPTNEEVVKLYYELGTDIWDHYFLCKSPLFFALSNKHYSIAQKLAQLVDLSESLVIKEGFYWHDQPYESRYIKTTTNDVYVFDMCSGHNLECIIKNMPVKAFEDEKIFLRIFDDENRDIQDFRIIASCIPTNVINAHIKIIMDNVFPNEDAMRVLLERGLDAWSCLCLGKYSYPSYPSCYGFVYSEECSKIISCLELIRTYYDRPDAKHKSIEISDFFESIDYVLSFLAYTRVFTRANLLCLLKRLTADEFESFKYLHNKCGLLAILLRRLGYDIYSMPITETKRILFALDGKAVYYPFNRYYHENINTLEEQGFFDRSVDNAHQDLSCFILDDIDFILVLVRQSLRAKQSVRDICDIIETFTRFVQRIDEKRLFDSVVKTMIETCSFDIVHDFFADKNNNSFVQTSRKHPEKFLEWCDKNMSDIQTNVFIVNVLPVTPDIRHKILLKLLYT